uniref:serine hydrolase n=1 Tax=Paractinoplanes polyasparticus TaxID=2856853 RepID=UPI001C84EBC0|nr:serine hydrolase [Actinoplanes polyasparticus]
MKVGTLVAVALIGVTMAACTDSAPAPPEATPVFWPTAGWRTTEPQSQGVDPAALAQLDHQIDTTFTEVRSVLIVRHGHIVHERYRRGLSAGSGHDVRSVTKSFVATLVGIAPGEGKILRLPTRELAKLGYLYLNGGRWEGTQVVPAEFVTAATTPTGLPPDVVTGYGLHWWIDDDGAGQRTFTAVGYGGQYIAVVPDRDLVVVVTNNPEGPPDPGSLLTGTILPGVT